MTLAARLAAYAKSLRYEQLDASTVHEVKRRVIDSLACACGAWRAHAPSVARRLAVRTRSERGAGWLGGGERRTSPELAAFADGVLIRYLDYNDTYLSLEPAHPSDNLAAVFAAADAAGADGREIIVATVLAYEIQCRLCDAASIRARGWDHVTYGAFSTAAAAARLLGLDAGGIEQALNLAGTPNVALRQTRAGELSEWKGCAFANAARNGVFAALLAAEGLTGPAPLFEGTMGFFRQVSGEFELEPLCGERDGPLERGTGSRPHAGLVPEAGSGEGACPPFQQTEGGGFMIDRTSIKFWPAEYHSQSAIHAALELRPQIGDPDRVKSIDIASFDAAVDIIGKDPEKWRPKTRETADHSLPYCVAVALMDGDVTLDSFRDERLRDERLLELVAKVRVHRDAALTAKYPRGIPNRIEVTLDDGRRLTAENEFPRGHDQNPMSDEELIAKFRRPAAGVLDEAQQDRLLDACWKLDEWENLAEFRRLIPAASRV
ncbi:MAG: MmgE/PrpD family protein [Planctomycetes bacterium]|nr:MmgE/PrpD family protein [Planctomycetota bacterium]